MFEPLDVRAFQRTGNRDTTEAAIAVQRAQQIIETARHSQNSQEIRNAVSVMLVWAAGQSFPFELWMSVAGMLRGVLGRPNLASWFMRVRFRAIASFLEWKYKRVTRRFVGERVGVGWFDHAMAYWFMTGDDAAFDDLGVFECLRAWLGSMVAPVPVPLSQNDRVRLMAILRMFSDVRRRHVDFDAILQRREESIGFNFERCYVSLVEMGYLSEVRR